MEEGARSKKGGIDWYLYREKILKELLYPYYEKVKKHHPDQEVFLVEDNAGGHSKAANLMEAFRKQHGILKAPHPPNSPDLNMMEGMWDYPKDRVEEYPVVGGSQADVEKAKDDVRKEWELASGKAKQL